MNGQIPWIVIALCLNDEVVFCPLGSLAKKNNAFMKNEQCFHENKRSCAPLPQYKRAHKTSGNMKRK